MLGRFRDSETTTGVTIFNELMISDCVSNDAVAVSAINGTSVNALMLPNFLNEIRKSFPLSP